MKNLQFCRLGLGVILEFYYIKRGLSAILKLRVRLGLPYVELHHGTVLGTLSLLLLAGSEFTSLPPPLPPSPHRVPWCNSVYQGPGLIKRNFKTSNCTVV